MDGARRSPRQDGCGPALPAPSGALTPLRQQIFECIRGAGAVSRAEVAKRLGVSPGTVSTVTAELIERGYVVESDAAREGGESLRGRPPVGLAVRAEAHVVAGVRLSDRDRSGILVDFAGNQLAACSEMRDPAGLGSAAAVAREVAALADRLLGEARLTRADLSALGLGLPGFVDQGAGRVVWSPILSARNVDLAAAVSGALGAPAAIDNDANLVALAELWFGEGRGIDDFAVVTIENGVGIGVVLNRQVFRGAHGLGLELGHTKVQLDGALCRCGQRGCLEAYISDYALAREAPAALGRVGPASAPVTEQVAELFAEARAGNAAAQAIFDRAGRYLALGLANVVNLFDPAVLILSGERQRHGFLRAETIRADMRGLAVDTDPALPPLVVHEWDDMLWAHGAAALALSSVTQTLLGADRDAAA